MGFMICHMQKLKSPAIKGIQIHNQREKESRSNSDIDVSRSELNYDLIHEQRRVDYKELIQARIDEGVKSNRAIRKDAVVCCSFMISASPDYMTALSPSEQRRFFQESLDFLKERYGEKNFVYASVHLDEKTPHMHAGFVPINDKEKLSAYSFFKNRSELQDLQDKIYEHIKGKGFDVERGISSDRKHLSTQRFKAETIKQEIQLLEGEKQKAEQSIKDIESRLSDLGKSLDHVKKVDEVEVKEKGGLIRSKTVELAQEDFESIKTLAKNSEAIKTKSEQFESDWIRELEKNDRLKDQNKALKIENDRLKKENKELIQENTFLKRTIDRFREYYKERIKNLDLFVGYFKGEILDKMKMKPLKKYFSNEQEEQGGVSFFKIKEEQQQEQKKTKSREQDHGPEL